MTTVQAERSLVHVRFGGRSEELPLASLGLCSDATDDQIKRALTAYFDRPSGFFDDYVVVRHPAAIVVRPEAIYG